MIGKTLASYKILELLGKGGMGEVYLAEDLRLRRRIALKVLPVEVSDDAGLRRRLEEEGRAVASLQHPNIVTLFSVEEAEGRLFLTMELVSGPRLSDVIVEPGLDFDRLMEIALQLTGAVSAAHHKGIVHRDLKPSNVMFTEDGHLKILDFGLAKQLGTATTLEDTDHTVTTEGAIVGTYAYLSPEQAQGRELTTCSDVFALGTLLYEMATGKKPFQGDNAISVISAILKDEAPDLMQVRPDLPEQLARIIHRCLAKDTTLRYSNASELYRDLNELRSSTATSDPAMISVAQATAVPKVTARRRPRQIVSVLAGIVVVLAALWGVSNWLERPPAEVASQSVSSNVVVVFPFENLGSTDDAYFADGVTAEIVSRLTAVAGVGVIARTTAIHYDRFDKSMQQIGAELGVSFVLEGTIRWDRSGSQNRVRIIPQLVRVEDGVNVWSDTFDRRLVDVFVMQSEIAAQVVGHIDASLASATSGHNERFTRSLDAYDAYLRSRDLVQWGTGPDSESLSEGIALLEQAIVLDGEFALAHASLSQAHSAVYFRGYDISVERIENARKAAERALEIAPGLAEAHLAMGLFHYRNDRDYPAALEQLELGRKLAPGNSEIISWIGTIYKRQGNFERAREILEPALKLDPRNLTVLGELFVVASSAGDFADALTYIDRAISIEPSFTNRFYRAEMFYYWHGDLVPMRQILQQTAPSPTTNREWANLKYLERDFGASLAYLDLVQGEVGPEAVDLLTRARIHFAKGDRSEAQKAATEATRFLDKDSRTYERDLALAYAFQERKAQALQQVQLLLAKHSQNRDALFVTRLRLHVAEIGAVAGAKKRAISLLEEVAQRDHRLTVSRIKLDPRWDPLRQHPQFKGFMAKQRQAQRKLPAAGAH